MFRLRTRKPARRSRRGALTLEWIVLMTIVGIGVIVALGVVRNELVEEFVELVDMICAMDVCN